MKIQVLVKEYLTKDGSRKFTTMSVKGEYLPAEVKAESETWYRVRPVRSYVPAEAGIYELTCDKMWIDKRADFVEQNILRVMDNINYSKVK